ncbi:MAG: hypothetical protein JW788_01760 [Candidatus Omnitrophica bacterium]|nr:hypothetical protein [Candidatus Omnitrophota bacterium]
MMRFKKRGIILRTLAAIFINFFLFCAISQPVVFAQGQHSPLRGKDQFLMPASGLAAWQTPQQAFMPDLSESILPKIPIISLEMIKDFIKSFFETLLGHYDPPTLSEFRQMEGARAIICIRARAEDNVYVNQYEIVEVRDEKIYSLGTGEEVFAPGAQEEWGNYVLEIQISSSAKGAPAALRYLNDGALDACFPVLRARFGDEAIADSIRQRGVIGFANMISGIERIGQADFKKIVAVFDSKFGRQQTTDAFIANPEGFISVVESVKYMGLTDFERLVDFIGNDVACEVLLGKPNDAASALMSISFMSVDFFITAWEQLDEEFGSQTSKQLFQDRPGTYTRAVSIIAGNSFSLDRFLVVLGVMEQEFGPGAVKDSFLNDPAAFVTLAKTIDDDIGLDNFRSDKAVLVELLGRESVECAFREDARGFYEALLTFDNVGEESFRTIVGLLGQEECSQVFSDKTLIFSFVIKDIYSKIGIDDLRAFINILGQDSISRGFSKSPYEFLDSLKLLDDMGQETFRALTRTLGTEGFSDALARDPLSFNAMIRKFCLMGDSVTQTLDLLTTELGRENVSFAFSQDAAGFVEVMQYLNEPGNAQQFRNIIESLYREFGREEVLGVLVGDNGLLHIDRFRMEDIREIISNRIVLNRPGDNRPVAVIIYPVSDWNGAFAVGQDALHSLIAAGYRVIYYEVATEDEMIAALKNATQYDKASFILIGGHGTASTLSFGTVDPAKGKIYPDEEAFTLDLNDETQMLEAGIGSSLAEGGVVALLSCSTGEGECSQNNVANMLYRIFPQAQSVIAPMSPTNITRFIFDDDNMVIGVEYSSDVDFDAATCPISTGITQPVSSLSLQDIFFKMVWFYQQLLI